MDLYVLDRPEGWDDIREAIPFIRAIFPGDLDFQRALCDSIQSVGINKVSGIGALIGFLKNSIETTIQVAPSEDQIALKRRFELVNSYYERIQKNAGCYRPERPEVVFWPDPTRTNSSASIYTTFPVVKNYELIDSKTPISSAGSCFAYEIAYSFQRRNFNYVVTESAMEPDNGILAFGRHHECEDQKYARFSANWGLLFNTANLRQMAERAFGVKEPKRILSKITRRKSQLFLNIPPSEDKDISLWVDPFREDVIFTSVEAYEKNYPIHSAKCREALMKAKIFIATIGLVEAWEVVEDGSVISYNPQSTLPLIALTRPKLLSVKENIENMQQFIDVIRKFNPEMKFIFTLSPISLTATFRHDDQHVITADGYSKANLRVAIEEVVKANEGAYYFPSFEFVNRCVKDPWDADERHVKNETVKKVMQLFDKMFVKSAS